MPVVVVDQPKFVVHVFAGEAEFVLFRHVAFRRDQTSVRPVFIQGAAFARFPEEGGDVFHRVVHAVEMFLHLRPVRFPARHGQDARGLRFRGVPEVTAHNYRRFPGQVALRHLQVVTVEVARVEARCPSDRHFFLESPAHGVVGAFHGCPAVLAFKFHGPVFGVVGDCPDAGGSFHQRLVAVGVVLGDECRRAISGDARIPVEFIGFIVRGAAEFEGFLPVADVVVLIAEAAAGPELVSDQFATAVVGEQTRRFGRRRVPRVPAPGRTAQRVVVVFVPRRRVGASGPLVVDDGEEVAAVFIGVDPGHAVGVGELFHKPSLFAVSPGEGRFHAFRREGGEAAFAVIGQVRLLDAAAVRA